MSGRPLSEREWTYLLVNWRKWGLGFSLEFGDPAYLRIWIGPFRFGVAYGHPDA